MTKKEEEHLDRVASLGCILCHEIGVGYMPAEIHHIRQGQGMGQRAGNYLVLPLCPDCHRGPKGIHGDRSLLRMVKMTEWDLLDLTLSRL